MKIIGVYIIRKSFFSEEGKKRDMFGGLCFLKSSISLLQTQETCKAGSGTPGLDGCWDRRWLLCPARLCSPGSPRPSGNVSFLYEVQF